MELLDTLGELEAAGAALVLHQQAIDTTTPAGRMFFQVTGAFAEFERGMIRSRVYGRIGARQGERRSSRPPQGSSEDRGRRTRSIGGRGGRKKVAKARGVGNGTVSRMPMAV